MTELTALASALHSKIWPLVANKAAERCETIAEENAYMNDAVARYAPLLVETPVEILGLIWGVHPSEAEIWREEVRAAMSEAAGDAFLGGLPEQDPAIVEYGYKFRR